MLPVTSLDCESSFRPIEKIGPNTCKLLGRLAPIVCSAGKFLYDVLVTLDSLTKFKSKLRDSSFINFNQKLWILFQQKLVSN